MPKQTRFAGNHAIMPYWKLLMTELHPTETHTFWFQIFRVVQTPTSILIRVKIVDSMDGIKVFFAENLAPFSRVWLSLVKQVIETFLLS